MVSGMAYDPFDVVDFIIFLCGMPMHGLRLRYLSDIIIPLTHRVGYTSVFIIKREGFVMTEQGFMIFFFLIILLVVIVAVVVTVATVTTASAAIADEEDGEDE